MTMRNYLFLLLSLFTGCASTPAVFPINYQFFDNQEKRRIELVYQNDSADIICLAPEMWPNSGGAIDGASRRVFLVAGDRR